MHQDQRLEMVALSDKGRVRDENQDSLLIDPARGLFLLADGVGGGRGGREASALTVGSFAEYLKPTGTSVATQDAARRLLGVLGEAARAANRSVRDRAQATPGLDGMASTLIAGVLGERRGVAITAGDSRVYRYHRGALEQLSEDHSLARTLIDSGFISEDESRADKYKNVLTRAVGIEEEIEFSSYDFTLESGDIVLACSDGLTNMVSEELIGDVLASDAPLRRKAERLVALANEAGGRDNVSVILSRSPNAPRGIARITGQLLKFLKRKPSNAETAVDEG